jgi:hypothetical protein
VSFDRDLVPFRELRYVMFAERYGWTPDEVDNVPLYLEPWILPISDAIDEERERRRVEAAKDAKS